MIWREVDDSKLRFKQPPRFQGGCYFRQTAPKIFAEVAWRYTSKTLFFPHHSPKSIETYWKLFLRGIVFKVSDKVKLNWLLRSKIWCSEAEDIHDTEEICMVYYTGAHYWTLPLSIYHVNPRGELLEEDKFWEKWLWMLLLYIWWLYSYRTGNTFKIWVLLLFSHLICSVLSGWTQMMDTAISFLVVLSENPWQGPYKYRQCTSLISIFLWLLVQNLYQSKTCTRAEPVHMYG